MRPRKARKEKGKDLSPKANRRGRLRRSLKAITVFTDNERSQPKTKPEARSCMTNDFLFAMMNTKSKPNGDIPHGNADS